MKKPEAAPRLTHSETPMIKKGEDNPDRPKVTSVKIVVTPLPGVKFKTQIILTTNPPPTPDNLENYKIIVKYPESNEPIPDDNLTEDYDEPVYEGNTVSFNRNNYEHQVPEPPKANICFTLSAIDYSCDEDIAVIFEKG